MTKPQLLLLCSKTSGIQRVSSKKKVDIMAKLLINHLKCQQLAKRKFAREELPALKKALLQKTTRKTLIINFYNDHYSWLDQIDKDYNKIMQSTYQQTYGKLLRGTTTEFFVRNVWAMGEERKMVKKSERKANKDMSEQERKKRLIQFIADACNFIVIV